MDEISLLKEKIHSLEAENTWLKKIIQNTEEFKALERFINENDNHIPHID